MARYNSSSATTTINGATTVSSPYSGAFTNLTGTAPYTVTLPAPALFPGSTQTFYNATAGTITLSTPSGLFGGLGASGSGTLGMPTNTVTTVTSDGTNYIVLSEDGSALVATSGSFTGDVTMSGSSTSISSNTITISPGSSGTINNMAIGGTTRAAGSFVALNANGQVNFTSNTASSSTTTGTLVVTGGIGASGTIYAGGFNGNLTGTIQTAAQTNITSVGTLSSLSATGTIATNGSITAVGDIITTGGKIVPYGKSIAVPSTVSAGWYRFAQTTATTAGENGTRGAFKATIISTGGYMSPGQTVVYGFKDWVGTALISHVVKTGAQYFTSWRIATSSTVAYLEGYTSGWSMGGANSLQLVIEPYGFNPTGSWSVTSDSTLTAGLASSTISIYNPTLTIDSNNGRVGVNTDNPTTSFSVKATDGAAGGIRLEHSAGNGPMVNISQQGSDGYIDMYTGENPTTLRNRLTAYGVSYFNPGGGTTGKVAISTTSAFSALQVGGNTFNGGHGMYANNRVGISNHGALTGLMLASTYNDATYPEYGLVFVHGGSTSSYNVWSLSPDGPAKGSDLNFIYQANSTNIHVAAPTMRLQGSTGRLKVGTNNSYAINEPAIISNGPVSNRDGRYITGWWVGATSGSYSWLHIKTNLWGGGSPRGNDMYIMGGFHIMGYYYSVPGNCDQWIMFHNWVGAMYNYNRTNAGNWQPDNAAYVGSDGYVYIRLASSSYMGYHIDLHQFPIYTLRDITVLSTTYSNNSTI